MISHGIRFKLIQTTVQIALQGGLPVKTYKGTLVRQIEHDPEWGKQKSLYPKMLVSVFIFTMFTVLYLLMCNRAWREFIFCKSLTCPVVSFISYSKDRIIDPKQILDRKVSRE